MAVPILLPTFTLNEKFGGGVTDSSKEELGKTAAFVSVMSPTNFRPRPIGGQTNLMGSPPPERTSLFENKH